jgi:hypothetical protein
LFAAHGTEASHGFFNPRSSSEMAGRDGAAVLTLRKQLCGLNDRCKLPCLKPEPRHEGGVEPPQPGL